MYADVDCFNQKLIYNLGSCFHSLTSYQWVGTLSAKGKVERWLAQPKMVNAALIFSDVKIFAQ